MADDTLILCFGGGGFTHARDPALEEFCLALLPPRPVLGYVGWANGDDPLRIARFYDRFRAVAGGLSHLPCGATAARARDWLRGRHMVFFGGGRTDALIAALRAPGLGAAFGAANRAGCVLAGVSAGGVCWFDWILSEAGGSAPAPLPGLGAVAGGVCPHYDTEPARAPLFARATLARPSLPAHAVDDGAGLVAVGGQVRGHVSARPGSAGYRLTICGGRVGTGLLARLCPTDLRPPDLRPPDLWPPDPA